MSRWIGFFILVERWSLVAVSLEGVLLLLDPSSPVGISCVVSLGSVSLTCWDRLWSSWSIVTVVVPFDLLQVVEWIGIE